MEIGFIHDMAHVICKLLLFICNALTIFHSAHLHVQKKVEKKTLKKTLFCTKTARICRKTKKSKMCCLSITWQKIFTLCQNFVTLVQKLKKKFVVTKTPVFPKTAKKLQAGKI